MLNHLFAFLDTQLVEPPWSSAAFLCIRVIPRLWWGGSFSPPPHLLCSTGHSFMDLPSVAACIWLAREKSERSLILSREKAGFKVVYLLPVTEDVRWEWSERREELPLMWRKGIVCWNVFSVRFLSPLFSWPWSSREVDPYITPPVCTENLPEVLKAPSRLSFSLVKLFTSVVLSLPLFQLSLLVFVLWFLWIYRRVISDALTP